MNHNQFWDIADDEIAPGVQIVTSKTSRKTYYKAEGYQVLCNDLRDATEKAAKSRAVAEELKT